MENAEVNKIIAEYMGYKDVMSIEKGNALIYNASDKENWQFLDPYTQSLDRLVPVWEKLDFVTVFSKEYKDGWLCVEYYDYDYEGNHNFEKVDCKSSMAEAAAFATAKEIKGLNK